MLQYLTRIISTSVFYLQVISPEYKQGAEFLLRIYDVDACAKSLNVCDLDIEHSIIDEIPGYTFRRLQTRLCELQRQYEITEAYLKAKYTNKSTL